jgi:hypothetical protein
MVNVNVIDGFILKNFIISNIIYEDSEINKFRINGYKCEDTTMKNFTIMFRN